jgi:hypothetical protein
MGDEQQQDEGPDAGGIMHRLGEVWDGLEMANNATGIGSVVNTAKAIGEEAPTGMKLLTEGAEAAEEGGGLLGDLGGIMGPAGNVISGISGVVNGVEAGQDFAKEGYHSDEAWDHVGGAILGGAGAATAALGPYAPVASAALGAGEATGA